MSHFKMMFPCTIPCVLAAFLSGTPTSALAAIRYVNAARPNDSGDGLSWAAAKKTLQGALVGAIGGDEVWVAAGVYKPDQGGGQVPGNRSATFQLVSNVAVYGGFVGGETSLSQRDVAANPTILSGDLSGNDSPVGCVFDSDCLGSLGDNCLDGTCNISANSGENSFHVVTGTSAPSAVLDGFTVTAGNANSGAPNNRGGGMVTNGGSPIIANCLFTRNFAIFGGGGMYDSSNGTRVTSCTFLGNTCGNGGGGGGSGGGGMVVHPAINARIVKCTFGDNVSKGPGGGAGGDGGGLNISGGSTYTVLNCAFFGNRAATGGGLAISSAGGPIVNLAFSGNSATNGGALSFGGNSTLTNCTFSRNTASNQGGGIYTSASPTIRNSILWENIDAGGMDESAQIHAAGGSPVVNYSIVQGGWTGASGPGNLAGNPLFIDADGPDNTYGTLDDNLSLISGSPAIDSANSGHLMSDTADLDDDGDTAELIPIDVAGNARQVDDPFVPDTGVGPAPVVDMGAYEAQGPHVLYADAGAAGANNGSSWADAFVHLQSALSLASSTPSITEIWVADGSYMPDGGRTPTGGAHVNGSGNRTVTFQLLNGVALYGGFTGGETLLTQRNPALNETILSGDLLADDLPVACLQASPDCDGLRPGFRTLCLDGYCIINNNISENTHNVVTSSGTVATAIIDGFLITAGNANVNGFLFGGGIRNENGSPTITNCTIKGNSASSGGGMFDSGSNPKITDCTFLKNASGSSAAGLLNTLSSNPIIKNCAFNGNFSNGLGGGMANLNSSNPVVSKCTFMRNEAENTGGGIINSNGSSPVVTNCMFFGNTGLLGGGIMNQVDSDPIVTNCLFSGNSALLGGGISNSDSTTTPTIVNCSFSGNTADVDGGGMYNSSGASPSIRNSILWGNSDQGGTDSSAQIHTVSGTPIVHFSTVQGGWAGSGSNNLSSDPLFFDVNGMDNVVGTIDDNLRLRTGSPAINTGNTLFVVGDPADLDDDGVTNEQTPLDLDGQPRLVGMVDQGAYEYFTDCNNNGVPDATDIALGTSQDCGSAGKYWPENGIPDECDIANCVADLGCADCNLNGVPDACDIFNGSSFDADENRVPDECGFFTGNCILPQPQQRFWTCPDNWTLNGLYPDSEDSAAGISVNLPDGAIVVLDESVAVRNLWIQSGAELQMITPDTYIDVDQAIQVDGTLTMESCKIAGNTPPLLTIRAGGKFQTSPCTSAGEPSTMTAAEIRILGSDCRTPPCLDGGRVELDESIVFTSTGDLVIDGSFPNGLCEVPSPEGMPPSYTSRGSSSTRVEGAVYLIGAPHVSIESTIPWELTGNFENQSVRPDCFHWSGGALTMLGTQQEFEVAATDVGAVRPSSQVAGVGQRDFAMGAVTIAAGSSVTFRDAFDNDLSGQGHCTEAAYIGSLKLEAGASMTIQNCRVYYTTLTIDPSATISMIGCAELLATVVPPGPVTADPTGIDKVRYMSFVIPPPATAASGETAIQVKLISLMHPNPPNLPQFPAPNFTAFEGQVRYVGTPTNCTETETPPTTFKCAQLQCAPLYIDWSAALGSSVLHVTGRDAVPSSTYEVRQLALSCQGNEAGCTAASSALTVNTQRWGDIAPPFQAAGNVPLTQPNVGDIAACVDKFRGLPGAPIVARADINPAIPNGQVQVPDIASIVDGFRGFAYPFTGASGPQTCP